MNQPFLDKPNCEALPDTERSESEGDRGDVAAMSRLLRLKDIHNPLKQRVHVLLLLHHSSEKFCC